MQRKVFQISSKIMIGAAALLWSSAADAEDRVQALLDSKGKVVFTNVQEPVALPPTAGSGDGRPRSAAGTIPVPIRALVDQISQTHGVDPDLVVAMMRTESNFDRWAVSPKGARGLMQLIPETGHRFGVRDFFDPQQNIEGGVRYLRFLLEKFKGNLELSLAAYNSGENLVERLGRVPAIKETQTYVRKIRAIYTKDSSAGLANSVGQSATNVEPPPAPVIFKTVDEYGVARFSNIGPPN
jgi:soluble lytic murein transglycosylase-like protein